MNVSRQKAQSELLVGEPGGVCLPRIPIGWFRRAAGLSRHAIIVGVELWECRRRQHRDQKTSGIIVNASRVERWWPIKRESVAKGLHELERVGLIDIVRQPGQAPRVRILREGRD